MQLGFFAAQLCSYFFVYFFVVLHKKFNNEWCLEIKEEVTVGALFLCLLEGVTWWEEREEQ